MAWQEILLEWEMLSVINIPIPIWWCYDPGSTIRIFNIVVPIRCYVVISAIYGPLHLLKHCEKVWISNIPAHSLVHFSFIIGILDKHMTATVWKHTKPVKLLPKKNANAWGLHTAQPGWLITSICAIFIFIALLCWWYASWKVAVTSKCPLITRPVSWKRHFLFAANKVLIKGKRIPWHFYCPNVTAKLHLLVIQAVVMHDQMQSYSSMW